MDELLQQLNAAGIRYLLIGGQAMRLLGLPRFSMDWDFFNPPRDERNLDRLNELLADDLDMPLLPLGPLGKTSFRPTRLTGASCNFISDCPAFRASRKLTRRPCRGLPR